MEANGEVRADGSVYVEVEHGFDLVNGPALHQLPSSDGDTRKVTEKQAHKPRLKEGGTLPGHPSCLRGHEEAVLWTAAKVN